MDLHSNFVPAADDFRGISLCAGYGGLDLGLHIAEPRYRTVAFVERESHAAAALVARMADKALGEALVWDDLRSFDGRPWRGRVHIVAAGYPCQPFSLAGRRAGASDPRHLWPEVARIVDEIAPEWVWCENVEGHLSLGYTEVAADLRRMGYTPKAGLFTTREAGGSHRRRRLFILAHADRSRCWLRARLDARNGEDPGCVADRRGGGERRAVPTVGNGSKLDAALADAQGAWMVGEDGELPIYAPGPGELQAWEDILLRHPDAQPAILRAGHGLADRMDRTRGAGNGVSSVAAALAWAVLKAAHQLPG